ncbi:MAG: CUAEP/CCAEP-tail radical SAM (seleno)protein [Planctomycetota bacterium]
MVLISCYELGHRPLGITGPARAFAAAGIEIDALDLAIEPLDPDRVRAARFVGISVPMHTALRLGLRVFRQIKAVNAQAHISFYGLYADMNRAYLLAQGADSCVAGDEHAALVALATQSLGAISLAPPASSAPSNRYSLPPLSRYARLVRDEREILAGAVAGTHGCKHHCRHCPIPPVFEGRFTAVPRADVLADIDAEIAAGAGHITFSDPDFLNGPRHALELVRALHARHPDVSYDFTAKVEHLLKHRAHLAEFARTGCVFIVSALESFSDHVLSILDKRHTARDALEAVAHVHAAGITLRPSFLPFTPWTTRADYLEMFELVETHALVTSVDPIQYAIRLLLPPGSLLLARPEMTPHLGALDAENFSYEWRHPDSEMDALQREALALVERHMGERYAPELAFAELRTLAERRLRAGGGRPTTLTRPPRPLPSWLARPPRLTEAWFC